MPLLARSLALDSLSLFLAAFVCLCAAPPGHATEGEEGAPAGIDDRDSDDVLSGFDDADDALSGFDEEEGDALDGFDDEGEDEAWSAAKEIPETGRRFWELSGSSSIGSSINYLDHDAFAGVGRTTDYQGVQRLRTRLNLQLDVDLPFEWKGRLAGYGFYDWAYLINGRDEYTDDVIDHYEWEVDFQEVWVEGNPIGDLDMKLGRQIVNWGRSDSLRVLDVLNPLDNREPGLTDIEDLRRPVTMLKTDYYCGNWSFTAIAIPEMRFDLRPPLGNDFAPVLSTLGTAEAFIVPSDKPGESVRNTEWAGAIKGIFSGWDVSIHGAYIWDNSPYLHPELTVIPPDEENPLGDFSFDGSELRYSRVWMVGAGGNYTFGSWLFKSEIAYFDGFDYATSTEFMVPVGDQVVSVHAPTGDVERSRLDFMGGIEYYGFTDTNISIEVANRHIFGFRDDMRPLFGLQKNFLETAIRITRNFLNERLEVTALGIIFGNHAQDGSIVRLDARYDLRDALELGVGIVFYQRGDPPPFDIIKRNDRIFLELKYSF
jgi:hypothetical protein